MQSRVWMVLSLVITCLISAFALSQVYNATAPVIRQRALEDVRQALSAVMPEADSFLPVPGNDSLWFAYAAGQRVGTILRAARAGYGGPVPVVVGVDLAGRITRIVVSEGELKETKGLGTKVTAPDWCARFAGRTADSVLLDKNGGPIEAITGATISSRAVTDGIRAAMQKYQQEIRP